MVSLLGLHVHLDHMNLPCSSSNLKLMAQVAHMNLPCSLISLQDHLEYARIPLVAIFMHTGLEHPEYV